MITERRVRLVIRQLLRLCVIVLTLASVGTARAQTSPTWLFVSDVHFNPLDDPALADRLAAAPVEQWDAIFESAPRPLSPYGTDANAPLFRLALANMKADAPDATVVVTPGDLVVHNFRVRWNRAATNTSDEAYFAFVDKTIAYIAHEFGTTFPTAQFVVTLGNNDSAYGDDHIQPHSPFLAHYEKAWEPLVDRDGRAPDFAREFPDDGNYVTTMPNGTHIVVANSNAWSPEAQSIDQADGSADDAARAGMAWFERAVAAQPSGAHTWALIHIPPGIDAYAAAHRGTPVTFYKPVWLARFRAVRAADGKPLGLIVAAHIHNDDFRIVDGTPLWLIPSISPIHGNNPAFEVAHIDGATGGVADYTTYNLDLAHAATAFAPEYSFNARYGLHGFTLAGLTQLERNLKDDTSLRAVETSIYDAGSPHSDITTATWPVYWCAKRAIEPDAFSRCLNGPSTP